MRNLGAQDSSSEITIPNDEDIQSEALKIYLEPYKRLIIDCKILNVEEVTSEILLIFTDLYGRTIWTNEEGSRPWPCKKIATVS